VCCQDQADPHADTEAEYAACVEAARLQAAGLQAAGDDSGRASVDDTDQPEQYDDAGQPGRLRRSPMTERSEGIKTMQRARASSAAGAKRGRR
jgi:hypothetical protein